MRGGILAFLLLLASLLICLVVAARLQLSKILVAPPSKTLGLTLHSEAPLSPSYEAALQAEVHPSVSPTRPPTKVPAKVRQPAPPQTDKTRYFFVSHHKTGHAISMQMCAHMRFTVTGQPGPCVDCHRLLRVTSEGTWCIVYWLEGPALVRRERQQFYPRTVRFWAGMNLFEALKIDFGGKDNYRLVHIRRDPLTTFASAFIYDQKGGDNMGLTKADFVGLSLHDALRLKAPELEYVCDEQTLAHEKGKTLPQHLEVRFEDFQHDYDGTTSRIFSFAMPRSKQKLRSLFVQRARADDQRRWSRTQLQHVHVSDKGQKKRVVAALRELAAQGDPAVCKALACSERLGYGNTCSGRKGGDRP